MINKEEQSHQMISALFSLSTAYFVFRIYTGLKMEEIFLRFFSNQPFNQLPIIGQMHHPVSYTHLDVYKRQEQNKMFKNLTFSVNTLDEFPSYCAPITAQEGAIILNTEMMKENNQMCIRDRIYGCGSNP